MEKSKKLLIFFTLFSLLLLNAYSVNAAAPTTGTAVAWTNDTYFDGYSSQSGVTTSDLTDTNSLSWQMFYANAPLSIPADAVNRMLINTYTGGNNTWNWRISISTADDTIGSWGAESNFAVGSATYTSGGAFQNVITSSVNIPAHRYFLIGIYNGPYYKSYKSLASNRTAQIGGVNYVTAINTIYYSAHALSLTSGIPQSIGGASTQFTTYSGYSLVASIKFKATGAPPLPALSTPNSPSVSSVTQNSAVLTLGSGIANAQSYVASLYDSTGNSFIESRTVTTSSMTSGYIWSGLTPYSTYQVGITAIGDGINYSNSSLGTKTSFTTDYGLTSVSLSLSDNPIYYRNNYSIIATVSGVTAGKITFSANGTRIAGCVSILVSSSTRNCAWRPTSHKPVTLSATFNPTASNYRSSTGSIFVAPISRVNIR